MALIIDNLSHSYRRLHSLREIRATAVPGKITALIGPNAAGKSTLLRCVIGALKPRSGQVTIDGLVAHRTSPRTLASVVAYVPQRSIVSAAFTAQHVIELGRHALPIDHSKVDDAIFRLDLSGLAHRLYPELSVGQQQRVTLARAVAQLSPRGHLILDEPVSAMDLQHVRRAMSLLRDLASAGATVVMAMHDLPQAVSIADDVWLLDQGRLIASGPVHEVLTLERLEQVFAVRFQWLRHDDGVAHLVSARV